MILFSFKALLAMEGAAQGVGESLSLGLLKEGVDVAPRFSGKCCGRWVVGLGDAGGLFQPWGSYEAEIVLIAFIYQEQHKHLRMACKRFVKKQLVRIFTEALKNSSRLSRCLNANNVCLLDLNRYSPTGNDIRSTITHS